MGILTGRDLCLGQESVECSSFRAQYAMANDNKPQKDRASDTARKKNMKAPAERPFDMWLHKQLHAMYDEIAAEPLPDDLLTLIERDAESQDKPSGNKR
jgi:Anti-sigma factor NepR